MADIAGAFFSCLLAAPLPLTSYFLHLTAGCLLSRASSLAAPQCIFLAPHSSLPTQPPLYLLLYLAPCSLACPSELSFCRRVQGMVQCWGLEYVQRKKMALQARETHLSCGISGTALSSAEVENRWQWSRQSHWDGASHLSCKKADDSLDCS